MNKVNLIGRVTKNIELSTYGEEGKYAKFFIAINEYNKNKKEKLTDFIQIVAWGNNAVFLSKYVNKGDLIGIEGKLKTKTYNRDGMKKYSTEIHINHCDLIKKVEKKIG
ncbi:single-stranded DNA-binding protein [Clostridium tarantellae]|uniref:Single-stranded DNA-binding protein n=1 Tax=Clostridium tarantellae TaxID=39493 RepID=A0A6I1MLD9_9CLOT|nr:single-stranded DNA-binding protein [Clostridium tarantellae]MPQ44326.1 single-stranded DNA-binding protein [Clostridium tarantellae]